MRRPKRATVRNGRLTGRQVRRLRKLTRPDEWGRYGYHRAPWAMRDARRLAEAAVLVVVATKTRLFGGHGPKEITFYASLTEARKRYPSSTAPFGRNWNAAPENKRAKKGHWRRRCRRLMREPLRVEVSRGH